MKKQLVQSTLVLIYDKCKVNIKSAYEPGGPSCCRVTPVTVARNNQEYFYFPLDGMLVYCRVTPYIKFAGTIYTPGWREEL